MEEGGETRGQIRGCLSNPEMFVILNTRLLICKMEIELALIDYLLSYIRLLEQIYGGFVVCCSVPQLCLILCDPMDYSMPGFPVLHHLPEFAQTHVKY